MPKIHKQALAKKDLKGIWRYSFENWGEKQADKYYNELMTSMELLADNPGLGVACDDIRAGYRRFRINHHVVYYKVTPSIITVVRVLHESMEPSYHFKDEPIALIHGAAHRGMEAKTGRALTQRSALYGDSCKGTVCNVSIF